MTSPCMFTLLHNRRCGPDNSQCMVKTGCDIVSHGHNDGCMERRCTIPLLVPGKCAVTSGFQICVWTVLQRLNFFSEGPVTRMVKEITRDVVLAIASIVIVVFLIATFWEDDFVLTLFVAVYAVFRLKLWHEVEDLRCFIFFDSRDSQ